MARVWLPCLARVRKRLYSDEVMKKRREEEEKRKKIEDEERQRVEAEAEAKRKRKEEEERLAEEERRRKKEEKRAKEADEKRLLEQRALDLNHTNGQLTSKLESLTAAYAETKEALASETSTRKVLEDSLEEALTCFENEASAKAAIVEQLAAERASNQKQIQSITATSQG